MLHSESRKGRAQSHRALIAIAGVLYVATLALCACKNIHEDAELTSVQLFALNTQKASERLGQMLSNTNDSLQADRMVIHHYRKDGQWVWTDEPAKVVQADAVVDFLKQQVGEMGFNRHAFFINEICQDLERLDSLRFDSVNTMPEVMARAEILLTRAYLRFARGQRFGFINPTPIFNHLDLRYGTPGDYRGLFDIPVEQPDSSFFVKAISEAIDGRALAFLQKLEPVDTIYQQLKRKLVADSTAEGRKRIICNMERRRWRNDETQNKHSRYVMVNLPSQQLWAIRPDSVFSMKICLGAWKTKTPMLHSAISLIDINPEWVIPMSIIRNEISLRAGDSAYFARHRYFITSRKTGDTINPKQLTPADLRSGSYRIAQQSGVGNSLGRIIFRFPNRHAVYLHDTNSRSAFNAERRTISHGCIRVQRPFDLAVYLLTNADEWSLDRIRLSIDMKPEGERGKEYLKQRAERNDHSPIRLIRSTGVDPHVPVYLTYYTLYPNPETGEWETWPDRYEYDKRMGESLSMYLH